MAITTRSSGRAETALVSLILGIGASPSVAADPFYAPPGPLPAGRPGELVRAEPTVVSLLPGYPLPATRSWRFMYRSTSATGDPMAVTGTLMVPTVAWPVGPRPLIAYAVGGHGMGRQCIPSVQFGQGTQVELAVVTAHLAQGWAVVVTDYQRTPAHTFLNAPASGHAVLDAARAALRVPGTGLEASRRVPVGVGGYGQGGLAAAAAAERQPAYAPELDLRGVTVGGAPADLATVLRAADGTERAGLVPMVLGSLRAAYPALALDGLSTAGRNAVAAVTRQCVPDLLDRWAGRRAAELTADGVDLDGFLATRPAWRDRLDAQTLGRRAPRAPVLVFHGLGGTWVPYGVTRRLADAWQAGGADVRLAAYPAVEHGGALVEAIPQVHHWLGARLTA
jgi:acetyl esterase/lipase